MDNLRLSATANLEVAVPRGDDGTLRDGIVTVLDRSPSIEDVDVEDINAVSPTQNAVHVDASVRVQVTLDDTVENGSTAVREAIADQLGVEAVMAVETTRSVPLRCA